MATSTSELIQRVPPAEKASFEEYIEWLDEDTRAEWVDGEIVLMPSPASIEHQEIGGFLYAILRVYVEVNNLGRVVHAPYVMKMAAISRGREPDLIFVERDRLYLITHMYLDGPADLAVEIVSPDSKKRDRKEKFAEYERAGVREYWIIDPDHHKSEFYELGADGRYHRVTIGANGIYRSKVVAGFWLRVNWLWQAPRPATLDVLRELKVLD
ncbi:MAG: Uma2 family endonuclease [Blastocatellia bacterium]